MPSVAAMANYDDMSRVFAVQVLGALRSGGEPAIDTVERVSCDVSMGGRLSEHVAYALADLFQVKSAR